MFKRFAPAGAVLALLLAACGGPQPLSGDWSLDGAASSIAFASVKNGDVAETHHFRVIEGRVDSDGRARLTIPVSGLETHVPERNENMLQHLFRAAQFPAAEVAAAVNPGEWTGLAIGETRRGEVEAHVTIAGVTRTVWADVIVTRAGEHAVIVASAEPVLLDMRDFGFEAAVETLRDIVALESITPASPASFHLVFRRD
ncbi:MAG: YceI family protein [Maricaulaceae bacterium]|nr:YceI family protein [Maricaulaceae bacterium]